MEEEGMKPRIQIAAAVTAAIVALSVHAAALERSGCIGIGPGSTLSVAGTSNVHDFESKTAEVRVTFACDSSGPPPATVAELEAALRASRVRALSVQVPVTSLHSGKSGLDKNLWQDLRSDAQPNIQVEFTRTTVTPRSAGGDTINLHAEGVLKVAGRDKPVTLAARVTRVGDALWLDGRQSLRMTEFGIKPRTMMLGTLRVRDEVTVRYHLLLVPAGATGETRTR
jgi:polyisoprenoid-binding protein YceI